jgi:hypothetical protein
VERVIRTLAVLAMLLITSAVHAQEKKPWNVDRICGRVEHVRRIPTKKQPDNYSEKRKNLRGIPLELYEEKSSTILFAIRESKSKMGEMQVGG